ncbi:hypothetical protein B0H14DRAFT_2875416, partial [Mycena olivaceomarginata]
MDSDSQFEPGFTSESVFGEHGPPPDRYTGTFFPRAKHFVVAGGNFSRIMNISQAAPSDPPDFRVIPLGDLDLRHEIILKAGSVAAHRRRGRVSARRMYSVHLHGSRSGMTAAVYQGDGAEEQWREEISRYSELRHPNLFQLYGIASAGGIHAAVFHNDLIPPTELVEKYRNSHFSTVFFWACVDREFLDVNQYVSSFSGRDLYWSEYVVWIRPSTGQLCLDLMSPELKYLPLTPVQLGCRAPGTSLLKLPEDSHIIVSISLQDYHSICYWHLYQSHRSLVSTNVPVKLGSIRHWSGLAYDNSFEIAFIPDCGVCDVGWSTRDPIIKKLWNPIEDNKEGTSILENGWIRVNSANVVVEYRRRIYSDNFCSRGWLAQANHIFNSLDITSNFEKYVFVSGIGYRLQLLDPIENLPPGYLFLCPLAKLETEVPACFAIPDCPAYWSLDPSGAERLNVEEAKNHGFTDIKLRMHHWRTTWDSSVYAGIRQFHQAKGFYPHGQEVAIALEVPLLQVSCEQNDLFANLHENDIDKDYSYSDGVSANEDFSGSGGEQHESTSAVLEDDQDAEIFGNAMEEDSAVEDIQDLEIDLEFSTAMEQDESPKHEDVHPLNEVSGVCHYGSLDEAEMFVPSRSWNLVMSVQLALFLILNAFSLYVSL